MGVKASNNFFFIYSQTHFQINGFSPSQKFPEMDRFHRKLIPLKEHLS